MSGPAIKTSPSLGDCTAQCPVGILAVAEHIFPAELLDLPSGLFSHPRAPAPVVGGIARRVPFLAVILGGEANLLQAHVELEDLPAVLDVRHPEERLGQSRSEERRVGNGCVSPCRSWGSPCNKKN